MASVEVKDIISPDIKKEISDIEKALSDLVKQLSETTKAAITMKGEFDKGAKSQSETSDRVKKVNKDLDVLAKSEQEIIKIEKQYQNTLARTIAERSEEAKQLERAKQLRAAQNKQIREDIKLSESEANSIDRLREANKKLIERRNQLNTSTKQGRAEILSINKTLDKNNNAIAKNSNALEKQKINIGNYRNAMSGLPGPIGRVNSTVMQMGQALKLLLLNPVILLIAALTAGLIALFNAFKSTDEGSLKFAIIMEQVRAVVDVLQQRLVDLIKVMSVITDKSLSWKERFKEIGKVFKDTGDQMREATAAAKIYEQELDNIEDNEISYISQKKKNIRDITKLETEARNALLSTEDRRDDLKKAIAISDEELKKQKEFANKKFNIEVDYLAAKYRIDRESIIKLIEGDDEQTNKLLANNKKLADFRNKINGDGQKKLEELYSTALELDTAYYQQQKRNTARLTGFEKELLKAEEDRLNMIRELQEEGTKEVSKFTDIISDWMTEVQADSKELSDQIKGQMKEQTEVNKEELDKQLEHYKKIEEEKAGIKRDIYNETFEIVAGLNEREMQNIEAQKEYELRLAGDNAGEREKIERKYDAERRKIQRRQAIIDKGQAVFNTILNTKEAFAKALTKDPTGILATFTAILGGIQLAAIIATPVPKFKKGTNYSPEGMAVVGEAGKELIEYPSGHKALTPDTATMTYLPKGSKVHTAAETKGIMSNMTDQKLDELIMETKRNNSKKPVVNQTLITDSGMKRIVKDVNSCTHYIDTYFRK